jgi:hypothetical protein
MLAKVPECTAIGKFLPEKVVGRIPKIAPGHPDRAIGHIWQMHAPEANRVHQPLFDLILE